MKKILITGASGFIGSHLVEKALHLGMETFAGVRKSSSRKYLTDPQIRIIELDFSNQESIRETLKKNSFDYIIHNAGVTHAPDLEAYIRVNYRNLQVLTELIIQENIPVQKFIYISSLAAFGPNECHHNLIIGETSVPHPITLYGESKLQAEEYLKKQPLPYIIIRPTAVYGPRDSSFNPVYQSIASGIEWYFTRKKQRLSFIYIEDLVEAIYKSMDGPARSSYFVSDGQEYTLQEFYRIIKTILKKRTIPIYIPIALVKGVASLNEFTGRLFHHYPFFNREKVKEIAASGWICDMSPLRLHTGFTPRYTLLQGLIKTLDTTKTPFTPPSPTS